MVKGLSDTGHPLEDMISVIIIERFVNKHFISYKNDSP
jgi:hypothetical protein